MRPCGVTERINAVTYKDQASEDRVKILLFDLRKPVIFRAVQVLALQRREQVMRISGIQPSLEQ